MKINKGQKLCPLLQREAQCDAATSGILFIPKAGAAVTSKFDSACFFFVFCFSFFLFFIPPKMLSSKLMDPQRGAKTAESTGIRCQCIPRRYPARTELTN